MISGGQGVFLEGGCSYKKKILNEKNFDINFDGIPDKVGYRSSSNCHIETGSTLWIGRQNGELMALSADEYTEAKSGLNFKVFTVSSLEIEVRETKGSHPYRVDDLITIPEPKRSGSRRNGQIEGFLFEVDYQTFQRRRVAAHVRFGSGEKDIATVDLSLIRFRNRPY